MANCKNTQQLNITCGTDVVLHDKLMFDGEVFDPNVSVDIECSLVNSLGKRTSLEHEIADEVLIIQIPWVDGRNAGCYGLEVKGKCNGKTWATYADSLIRYTRATVEGASVVEVSSDWYDITQVVSYRYSDSPLDEVDATIDDNYGEPTVTPTYEHNKLTLDFKNLRGNGIANVEQTVESTEPEGVNETTITQDNGNTTVIRVRNGKSIVGPQGIPGEGAIWTGEGEEIMALEQETGHAIKKAMSQKAVSDCVDIYDDINLNDSSVIVVDNKYIPSNGVWTTPTGSTCESRLIPVVTGERIVLSPIEGSNLQYAYLTNSQTTGSASFVAGTSAMTVGIGEKIYINIPSGAAYLYLRTKYNSEDRTPSIFAHPRPINTEIPVIYKEIDDVACSAGTLMSVVDDNLPDDNYAFGTNGKFGTNTDYKHTHITVTAGERYYIQSPDTGTTVFALATSAVATSGGDIPLVAGTGVIALQNGKGRHITIPNGCSYLLVYNGSNIRPYIIKRAKNTNTIIPKVSFGAISASTGDFSTTYRECNGERCATPRYIKTSDDMSITVDADCTLLVFYYGQNFEYLGSQSFSNIAAGSTVTTASPYNHMYVKLMMTTENYVLKGVILNGVFKEGWDVYNTRPTDEGYKMIAAVVNVTNPSCNDGDTQNVEDTPDYMSAWGLISLPNTYSNFGEPTRLIIYCHGAGTHINAINGSSWTYPQRFDINRHVDPAYWLAEGYAVMDMDGNPFDTTTAHAFIPQSVDCYLAGYKWVIEHYNICRDGVFLGGRSMGGGNTLCLMRQQCPIPVIAACANLPTSLAMNKNAANKTFGATHRGFILPDGFSWSDGTDEAPYNDTEKQVVINNWDKFITWQPITSLVTDMPIDDEFKWNLLRTGSLSGEYGSLTRVDVLGGLHVMAKCPLKMFSCYEDPNNPLIMAAGLYKKMFANSGQIAELRLFHSYKDYSGTGYTAHYYELQDPALRTTEITRYGEEVSNVPMVYVEMLQFWRRYEQE